MEITITPGTVDSIAIKGSIDALTSAELTTAIQNHIQSGRINVVLDFGGVDFMSSAGLRAILASVKEARAAGGDLRIAAVPSAIEKVMKMAGFHNIVKMYTASEEAVKSFEA